MNQFWLLTIREAHGEIRTIVKEQFPADYLAARARDGHPIALLYATPLQKRDYDTLVEFYG